VGGGACVVQVRMDLNRIMVFIAWHREPEPNRLHRRVMEQARRARPVADFHRRNRLLARVDLEVRVKGLLSLRSRPLTRLLKKLMRRACSSVKLELKDLVVAASLRFGQLLMPEFEWLRFATRHPFHTMVAGRPSVVEFKFLALFVCAVVSLLLVLWDLKSQI